MAKTGKRKCGYGLRTIVCGSLIECSRNATGGQINHQKHSPARAAYIYKVEHLDERKLILQ